MKNLYELRVAKVLSPLDIVINAGEIDGVQVGMTFVVYVIGDEVFDPETNVSLGHLEVVKGKVRVTQVQAALSVAHSAESYERKIPGPTSMLSSLNPTWEYVTTDKALKEVTINDLVRRIS